MRRLLLLAVLAIGAMGCSEDFNPTTSGPRPMVVFAILQAAADTQTVRVHPTEDPTNADPVPTGVAGATVTVTSSADTFQFQPVLLPGEPGTGVASIPAFSVAPFRPVRGRTYTLRVVTPSGTATATTEVPAFIAGSMGITGISLMQEPMRFEEASSIYVTATLSNQTLGFAVRMMLEYDVQRGAVWERELREVPTFVSTDSTIPAIYPALVRRSSSSQSTLRQGDLGVFPLRAYRQVLRSLVRDYTGSGVRMVRAFAVLYQADKHFFTYYAYANSFQDRLSIRLDRPDYSNVAGGLGVFGSLTTDTLTISLPSDVHTKVP